MAFLAVGVGLYPLISLVLNFRFPILDTKPLDLPGNIFWNIGFYSHITLGGIALLIGWVQFNKKIRNANLKAHRILGKVYVVSALISALSAIYISFYATGGFIVSIGFISLGYIWFYTTLKAYLFIKEKQIIDHKKMTIYSYAACFAAVTLRVYLPFLTLFFKDFEVAYRIVAWLCWVPNLMVAHFIIGNREA